MQAVVGRTGNQIHSGPGRGGRVVEGAALEKRYAGDRIAGSNPALSAILGWNLSKKGSYETGRGSLLGLRTTFQVPQRLSLYERNTLLPWEVTK